MGIKASDINEQSPWQEMTVGGEVYEGGTARGRYGSRRNASSVCCVPPSVRTLPFR